VGLVLGVGVGGLCPPPDHFSLVRFRKTEIAAAA
jgi:hypothetical protein